MFAKGISLAAAMAGLAMAPGPARADDSSVVLQAGHDYALVGISDQPDTVDLLDPGGLVVATVDTIGDLSHGQEFRARFSASYFIRDHDTTAGASWAVVPDCRGDAQTRCVVSINHEKSGGLLWPDDQDWWAIKLLAGRTYTAQPGGSFSACARFADAAGRALGGDACFPDSLAYKPARTGVAYLVMWNGNIDEGIDYNVVVRVR